MPYVCYAHESMQKLINLEENGKDIIIPSPHHYYNYQTGRIRLARHHVFPFNIIDYNYSILEKKSDSSLRSTRLVKTDRGEIYLFIPYNAPILLIRREI